MGIADLKISFLILFCISFYVSDLNAQQKTPNAFYFASEIAIDSKGNLFVVGSGNRIIKITPDGSAYHFAGHPKGYTQSKDGLGSDAMFAKTSGITIDGNDNLFISDYTTIRKVTPEGKVSTIYGNSNIGLLKEGNTKTATFKKLGAIAVDRNGILYVVDEYFDTADQRTNQVIRKVSQQGVTTILINDGSLFSCHYIRGLVCDKDGNLFVSAGAWSSAIIKISPEGILTNVAGIYDSNKKNLAKFKEGDVHSARILSPWGIAINQNDEIYFSDSRLNRIIKIANGKLSVYAGGGGKSATGISIVSSAGSGGLVDGIRNKAEFQSPHGIAFDKVGNLFVVDGGSSNSYIRKLLPDGMVTTFSRQEYNPITKQYEEIKRQDNQ